MECSASVHYCEQLELDGLLPVADTTFADEGTLAHELAAACLEAGESYHKLDNCNPEMGEYIQIYLDYANTIANRCHWYRIEEKLDFSNYIPDGFGTADFIGLEGSTCHVIDLKYGLGILVGAGSPDEPNPQLAIYGLGAIQEMGWYEDITEFVFHVVQPRRDSISTVTLTREQMDAFGEKVKVAAACVDEAPRFVPGDKQCQFCPGRQVCRARIEGTLSLFKNMDDIPMTDEEIAAALLHVPQVKKVCADLENYAEGMAKVGKVLPGFKLVKARTQRRWSSSAAEVVEKLVGEKGFEKKLLGIPAIEKLLGDQKVLLAEVIDKPVGSLVLAPMDDPRPQEVTETFTQQP
jgi:hypothetical protein